MINLLFIYFYSLYDIIALKDIYYADTTWFHEVLTSEVLSNIKNELHNYI